MISAVLPVIVPESGEIVSCPSTVKFPVTPMPVRSAAVPSAFVT